MSNFLEFDLVLIGNIIRTSTLNNNFFIQVNLLNYIHLNNFIKKFLFIIEDNLYIPILFKNIITEKEKIYFEISEYNYNIFEKIKLPTSLYVNNNDLKNKITEENSKIGYEVKNEYNISLGKVKDFEPNKLNQYYTIIDKNNKEILVPNNKNFIENIDNKLKIIYLKNVENIFEFYYNN